MSEEFAGKVALVTGGGNSIGAAVCRTLAREGAYVAVLDRDGSAAEKVAAEIAGNSGRAAAHALDVADGAAFAAVAKALAEQQGGVDILVNAAGTITQHTIAHMPAEAWERILAVNLRGPFNGVQAVLPHMRARGGGAHYSSSKAGLLGFTRHAAYELGPDHIRVNAVCPGPTATAFSGRMPSPETRAARAKKIPLGRMVEPEDIADAVLFLAGDRSRMCTGIALDVDGGVLISNDIPYEEYFAKMT